LWQVQLIIHLGHGGNACPNGHGGYHGPQGDEWEDPDDDDNVNLGAKDRPVPPGQYDHEGNMILLVVDKSGVHHVAVNWCQCEGAPEEAIQLFQMGLFPASFKSVKTAFTFQVLNDFLLDNLECKTSAHHYYMKLRRLTLPAFPHSVPVLLHFFQPSHDSDQ
jgi:hypothetical protein